MGADDNADPDPAPTAMVPLMRYLNPPSVVTVLNLLRSAGIAATSTLANENAFGEETDPGSNHTVSVAGDRVDEAKAALSAAGWKV